MDRARAENRVLHEMAGLMAVSHPYPDLVQAVLDLIEEIVSSPYLALSLTESGDVGHYPRLDPDVDREWADEVDRYVFEIHQQRLKRGAPPGHRDVLYHLAPPTAWMAVFSASSRSGRRAAITLGSPRPLSMELEEEQIMLRLTRQALLVLDHALLLADLEERETVDQLTGLANHHGLLEILDYELRRHRNADKPLGLLLLDVEGLRAINRSYGHQYGNHILSKVAGLIAGMARPIDTVARSGTDEFAVLLPETTDDQAHELGERLRDQVLAAGFAGDSIRLFIAAVHASPSEQLSAESLLQRGERVLHEAKRQEREWPVVWSR